MTVTIISHPDCTAHNMGDDHPESPARMGAIQNQLKDSELENVVKQLDAKPIKRDLLELAHTKSYIDSIFKNSPSSGTFELDPDTRMNPFTLNAALLSAGAGINAVDLVMSENEASSTSEKKQSSAFCMTRPPGHHAERNKAMGFCFFNNVAIAAIYAKQQYNLSKVAVVDFDVHHGNGTQEILADKDGFLFCSTFEHPLYPNTGTEEHPPHIINSPLPANTNGSEFREVIKRDWLPALNEFKPDIIFISAGFDAHVEDAISHVKLTESDYLWVTEQIKKIADQHSNSRIVSVLEGGYSLSALGRSVVAHVKGLIG
jgi:acetoin utilization deacetylase AcuC-like enzyme